MATASRVPARTRWPRETTRKLAIAINGGSQNTSGLTIAQQGSQVFGLDIENFGKDGVLITAGGNVQVAGCFIGTDPTGETRASNETGVVLENSFNMIGGPTVGDRNVISGSGNSGTFVDDGIYVPEQSENPLNIEPTGNVIENNIIGLDATGTKSIRNEYAGVEDLGSGNIYGGTTAGLGNLISGNLVLRRRVSRPTSHAAPSQLGEAPLAMGGGGFAIPLPPPLGPP